MINKEIKVDSLTIRATNDPAYILSTLGKDQVELSIIVNFKWAKMVCPIVLLDNEKAMQSFAEQLLKILSKVEPDQNPHYRPDAFSSKTNES